VTAAQTKAIAAARVQWEEQDRENQTKLLQPLVDKLSDVEKSNKALKVAIAPMQRELKEAVANVTPPKGGAGPSRSAGTGLVSANQRVKRLLEKAKTQEIFVFSPHDVDVAMHIDFLQSEQKHFAPQMGLIYMKHVAALSVQPSEAACALFYGRACTIPNADGIRLVEHASYRAANTPDE